jgi:uncharacterized protein YhfF
MMRTTAADRYWNQFVLSLPQAARPAGTYYDAFHFGVAKEDATPVAGLVLRGIKTSTGSLEWVYQAEGNPPPEEGSYSVILDSNDAPVGIIETTEVRVVPFEEAHDEQFAFDGGEDDRTLASWRKGYWSYIVSECARIHREPTQQTPLVCERFRWIYKEPLSDG